MKLSLALLLTLSLTSAASAAPDQAAAEKLAREYQAAWNRGDATAVAALYAQDAVFTTPDGKTFRGRDAIREALTAHVKGGPMSFSGHEFRELGATAMAWRCDWKAAGSKGPAMSGTGVALLVADKTGWLIVEDLAALTPAAPKMAKPAAHDHGDGPHSHDHGPHSHTH